MKKDKEKVIQDFGVEWEKFNFLDQESLIRLEEQFQNYIKPLPQELLKKNHLIAGDFGAGSGRWSFFLRKYCSKLYVVEPAKQAFEVCKLRFNGESNVVLLNQTVEDNGVPNSSLDLAISLGVLHHLPETLEGVKNVASKVKPDGWFLGYLYYALENKPPLYKVIWRLSDYLRKTISKMPSVIKVPIADLIAVLIYFPFARLCRLLDLMRISTSSIPLHHYSKLSFEVMRNDSLDRFGTSLENRFTKSEIVSMLEASGFVSETIIFSDSEPFWTFAAKKSSSGSI